MKKLIISSIFVLTLLSLTLATTCIDSDGGKIYDKKGYITITNSDGFSENIDDVCIYEYTVREYYCEEVEDTTISSRFSLLKPTIFVEGNMITLTAVDHYSATFNVVNEKIIKGER